MKNIQLSVLRTHSMKMEQSTKAIRLAPRKTVFPRRVPAFAGILPMAILIAISCITLPAAGKPRVVVMTDIGGDPDDQQSMVRFLSYANEFEIKGLYATSTGGRRNNIINVSILQDMVTAWGSVRGNLTEHASGWPTKDDLLSVIKSGLRVEGISWCGHGNGARDPETGLAGGICTPDIEDLIGDGKDTEASNHLITVIDESPAPTWVLAWGGTRELAQALWKVKETRTSSQVNTFNSRIRLYSISLQDETMPWLIREFPDLFIIRTIWSHAGIWAEASLDASLFNSTWCDDHIRTGHGALGAMYPGNLPSSAPDKNGMKEGDTPAVTYLIPNGLSNPQQPEMGNWGGRFYATLSDKHWFEAGDDNPHSDSSRRRVYWSVSRWHIARQNDFAARMDWQRTGDYEEANHNPVVILNGDATKEVMRQTVTAGTTVQLRADGSTDPDGDELQYHWWVYYEAGSVQDAGPDEEPTVSISNPHSKNAIFKSPNVVSTKTIHIILEVTDDGSPALTSYRRMVVTVKPAA